MRRGQLLLGHLCTRIFKGEVPEVGPDQWPAFVHSIVKRLGGIGHATARLHALLVRLWSVDSVQGISKLVGANLPENFVELELTLQMSPRMWLPRLIMLSAYESELSDGANVSAFQVDEGWEEATDDILKTLYATAAHQGVPRGIVARLLDGESFTRVRGVSTVTWGKFDSFRQALPVDALQLLTQAKKDGNSQRKRRRWVGLPEREMLRDMGRTLIFDAMASDPDFSRNKAKHLFSARYAWTARNDQEFLDAVLPPRKPQSSQFFTNEKGRRDACRLMVLEELRRSPEAGRSALAKKLGHRIDWLRSNDKSWFERQVPAMEKRPPKWKRLQSLGPLVLPRER